MCARDVLSWPRWGVPIRVRLLAVNDFPVTTTARCDLMAENVSDDPMFGPIVNGASRYADKQRDEAHRDLGLDPMTGEPIGDK